MSNHKDYVSQVTGSARAAVAFSALLVIICIVLSSMTYARSIVTGDVADVSRDVNAPAYAVAAHRAGEISLSATNEGQLGKGYGHSSLDYFTGESVPSCEYPINSDLEYLFGAALWIGAVVGDDTLVSVGADGWIGPGGELNPDEAPLGGMIFEMVVSDEDYIAEYTDTMTQGVPQDYFGRPHLPMYLRVTQRSFAWSYPFAEDFVLVEFTIENIGEETLNDVYIGMLVDGDVGHNATAFYTDDIAGFLPTSAMTLGSCSYEDTLNVAWIADNNGDPIGSSFTATSATGVTGIVPVGVPLEDIGLSFNWWVSDGVASRDFGPRERSGQGIWPEDYRDFQTGGTGTPMGDVNKYYVMRNREVDYDQVFTASIPSDDPLWTYPSQTVAPDISDGDDTRYLLSFGPFPTLGPGQQLPVAFAYVAGSGFHELPDNGDNLPGNPALFHGNLSFDDLAQNVRWAHWMYDNPGFDTDGDGYAGKSFLCGDDTIYYRGDGVPDFGFNGQPIQPSVRVEPVEGGLVVRWNGLNSETAVDPLTGLQDFEGYRVELAVESAPGSFSEIALYDRENFVKYTWRESLQDWEIRDEPLSLLDLRCSYGTSCDDLTFDPLDYTEQSPYVHPQFPDSIFYFEAYLGNLSEFGVETPIVKAYPGQPYPTSLDPAEADPSELTDEGYLKYFEYRLGVSGLQHATCYLVRVNRFDFGSVVNGLPPDESAIGSPVQACTPAAAIACGDIDGDGVQLDISDQVYLVNYMFHNGPPPADPAMANLDGKGPINIADLVIMVLHMYAGGPAPTC